MGDSVVGSSWRLRSTLEGGGMSIVTLCCVKSCGDETGGPKPCGSAGAAGITSTGTVMPAGGFTEAGRAAAPGRGGNADGDLAVEGASAAAAPAPAATGETACTALGAVGDRALDGTPAYGSA